MTRGILIGLMVALAMPALAQEPADRGERVRMMLGTGEQAGTARIAVETRVTRGAPYAADAVSEFVQVLSDGNRIVRRTTTHMVRDSEGRTRRETIGQNGAIESVVITDPVSSTSYVLDPTSRTARRAPGAFAAVAAGARGRGGANTVTVTGAGGGTWTATSREGATTAVAGERVMIAGGRGGRGGPGEGQGTREDLGQQTIEGVAATGTRTTTTIAAGAVGNEQPITIVSEQWYSTDLQMLILTKHNDPRVGESIYRVTNIVRSEPDQALFQVPADYTLRSPE